MPDPYDLLHTSMSPKLLEEMRAKGMSTSEIMTEVGLLGESSRLELEEALKKKPEVVDRMHSPEFHKELQLAVSSELNAHADELKSCGSVSDFKHKLREIAKGAAQNQARHLLAK